MKVLDFCPFSLFVFHSLELAIPLLQGCGKGEDNLKVFFRPFYPAGHCFFWGGEDSSCLYILRVPEYSRGKWGNGLPRSVLLLPILSLLFPLQHASHSGWRTHSLLYDPNDIVNGFR